MGLTRRDENFFANHYPVYWSADTAAIKWGILFGILFLCIAVAMAMWYHARYRIKKGLQPLRYHRWLLSRADRQRLNQQPEQNFTFYQQQREGYDMYPVPPPAYNPAFQQPPGYEAPKSDPFRDPATNTSGEGSSNGVAPPPLAHTGPPPVYR